MSIKTFGYTSLVMNILEKILGTKFTVSGIENISDQPTMFVANHFTRSETFFVPYLIYKKTGKQTRTLADHKLYVGMLGKFLNAVGAISTKNENRDNIILHDLVCADYNWIIYPEGSMVKNKQIIRDELFISNTPYRIGPVRTGSAVLALKSQLLREDIIEAFNKNDQELLNEINKNYQLIYDKNLLNLNTNIVPLNITYYPIRPGKNKIQEIANRLVKKIPKQIIEELEIEGKILTEAEINIHFGKPINLANYVKNKQAIINQIPIIKKETKNNLVLRYYRSKLTNIFMEMIYYDTQINFDHLFVASLKHFPNEIIEINFLKKIIFYSAILIIKSKNYRLNQSLLEENIIKIFGEEKFHNFDDVFELALNQNVINYVDQNTIKINKSIFDKNVEFHDIRIENTLQVIANEFALLDNANAIIKRVAKIDQDQLNEKIFNEIYNFDQKKYLEDYHKNFDPKFSKDISIGKPYFFDSDRLKSNCQIGIVLCHGYKSSPMEVKFLAQYLNQLGYKVYAVRIKGHGTSPIDLSTASWQDWYDSVQIGYSALSMICKKIIMIGFSTGGLLTLLTASKKFNQSKLQAIISINSAIKLVNISSKFANSVNLWNEILNKFSISKAQFQYVDDHPENPEINYSRNYISGVVQLEKLMDQCERSLPMIKLPTLIIQADKDPVVNPESAKNIYQSINSSIKQLIMMDYNNHVIIYGNNSEKVFVEIKNFLYKLNLI
jgi:esterase/lipase/1-acyl-sn-glycerol-3-phosphate acyltransferase